MLIFKVVKLSLKSLKTIIQSFSLIQFLTQHIIAFINHVLNFFKSYLLFSGKGSKFNVAGSKFITRFIITRFGKVAFSYLGTLCHKAW